MKGTGDFAHYFEDETEEKMSSKINSPLRTCSQKFHRKYLNNFSVPWITLEVSLYEAHDFKGSNLVMS